MELDKCLKNLRLWLGCTTRVLRSCINISAVVVSEALAWLSSLLSLVWKLKPLLGFMVDFVFCRDTYFYSRGVAPEVSFRSYMKLNTSAGNIDLYKKLYSRYLCLIKASLLPSRVFPDAVRGAASACSIMQASLPVGVVGGKETLFSIWLQQLFFLLIENAAVIFPSSLSSSKRKKCAVEKATMSKVFF